MSSEYVLDMESKIYTLIKSRCYPELSKKYKTINFTTSDEVSENPQFPTVYICESSSPEKDIDLIRVQVNSVLTVFDVKVTVDTDKQDVTKIMGYILNAFKNLRFELVAKSKVITDANMYYMTASFKRKFGSDDVI